jgi:neutral ceramidase
MEKVKKNTDYSQRPTSESQRPKAKSRKPKANNQKPFQAGAAQVDITPVIGSFVGVDFLTHYARFIHDPLYSKAIVFDNGETVTAIIVVDICIMPTDLMDEMKVLIESETGIKRENILISSTHTHAAPAVIGLLSCSPDLAYMRILPGMIVQSVKKALANLKPAKICSAKTDVPQHVLCRRYILKEGGVMTNPITGKQDQLKTNPFGQEHLIVGHATPVDPELGLLGIKDLNDNWIAVLANYSLHYVGDWHVDSISADYFGEFSKQIKSKLGASNDFVGIMTNGTSGDINIWDFAKTKNYPTEDLAKTKVIGGDLANAAFEVLQNVSWNSTPTLAVKYKEFTVKVDKPNQDLVEKSTAIVINTENYNHLDLSPESMVKIYAREQVLLSKYPEFSYTAIQAIQVGDQIIGALGGEFFAETGLKLKKEIEGNFFAICLANTYDGYILPAHEIEKGGYESWRARSSYLVAGSEKLIRNELVKLVENLNE